jgi:hypothetical protein
MEKINRKNIITIYRDDVFLDEIYHRIAAHPLTIKGVDDDGHEYVNLLLASFHSVSYENEDLVLTTAPDLVDETPSDTKIL